MSEPLTADAYMEKVTEQLRAKIEDQPDTPARAAAAHQLAVQLVRVNRDVSALRRAAFRDLMSEGWRMSDIAHAFQLSQQRVAQIVEHQPKPKESK